MRTSPPSASPRHDDLADLGMRLSAARSLIEGKFLEVGVILGSAVEVVGALVGALDRLSQTLDAEVVDRSAANLTSSAAALNDLASAHGERSERLQQLARTNAELGGCLSEISRTLGYVRAFAINIKITAAGIPGAASEFDTFSEEIRDALAEARRQLDDFDVELAGLSQSVNQALRHEADLGTKCAAMLPALPNRLQADADAMAAHHRATAALAVELAALARKIQGKVAGALGALQIGDSTRQRVEHVETALDLLSRNAAKAALEGPVHGLLAAQLQDAAEQMSADVERLGESLAGVADDAEEVLRLARLAAGGRGDSDADVLHQLEASIADAMRLVGEIEKGEAAADAIGRSAGETAAGLTERISTIRSVRTSIHFLALNAHLKCCHLGAAGGPLSVVAVELRARAGDLETTADQAEAALSALGGAASTGEEAQAQGAAEIGQLLENAIEPIRAAAASVGSDLAALGQQGESIVRGLKEATSRLNFHRDVLEVLDTAAGALAADGGRAGRGGDEAEALQAILAEIGALYTMARERQVQAAFLESAAAAGRAAA
jgi:chromosome segregation ATPase